MALKTYLMIKNWLQSEEGQDVVEYAVLVIFIAILVIVAVTNFGEQMKQVYNNIAQYVQSGLK